MASELRVNTITEATSGSGITFAKDIIPATPLSHRNMVINGAMQVHQRGGTINFAHDGVTVGYSLDRYRFVSSGVGQWDGTIQQHSMSSADHNTTGFSKALLLTTGTAESGLGVSEYATLQQIIEAQNLQHLQYGTASAKSVTLSFWAKTSVTGTYAIGLYKHDSTNRVINKTYTVSDTGWNKYTITFPGDTDSGATIANDNGRGIYINWHLAAGTSFNGGANTSWEDYGSDNTGWAGGHAQNGLITTAGATFYLTGVQLELGLVATPFEHRSYGEEFQRCLRYYEKWKRDGNDTDTEIMSIGFGMWYGTSQILGHMQFAQKRATPTITVNSADWARIYKYGGAEDSNDSASPIDLATPKSARFNIATGGSGNVNGGGAHIILNSNNSEYIEINADYA